VSKSDFQKFVESGEWYLDTQAPDYKEKLHADVLQKQTPQDQADVEQEEDWFEEE